jgi:ribonucleoside-diphosphate reductase subunit M2
MTDKSTEYNEILELLEESFKDGDSNGRQTFMAKLDEKYNKPNELDLTEPILNPKNHKFTAFPIQHTKLWKMYKSQMASFWKSEEVDFSKDYDDFLTLNKDEQYFIEMILAFFAASDGIVNFNLSERFIKEVQITEAIFVYQFQTMMENVHSETYSLMLENIVRDPERRDMLFNAIETIPAVKGMADWAFKWIESSKSFAHRVVAFALVEGVFFSGAFAAIYWIKKYKNNGTQASSSSFMKGLTKSNKFIARDEGMHCTFACQLYKLVVNKLSQQEINEIVIDAVKIAQNFMVDAIPVRLIGMNNELMCDYIEYIGDRLLSMLGYKKLFMKKNPFKFMETIGLDSKANFFEESEDAYQDAHIMNKTKTGDKTKSNKSLSRININSDF